LAAKIKFTALCKEKTTHVKKGSAKNYIFLIIEDPLICSDLAVLSIISEYFTFVLMEMDYLKC
jgi:hypothetical protein